LNHIVSKKLTDISEVITASIVMMEADYRLQSTISQKAVIFMLTTVRA
jgi:hypothetical protein